MIYSIKIGGISRIGTCHVGGIDFDISDGIDKAFSYCETKYGFSGDKWDEIKSERDLEELCGFLKENGINCEIYDDE